VGPRLDDSGRAAKQSLGKAFVHPGSRFAFTRISAMLRLVDLSSAMLRRLDDSPRLDDSNHVTTRDDRIKIRLN